MSCGIASGLLSFLAPRLCPSCGEVVLGVGEEVCESCLEGCGTLPERRCPQCGGPNVGMLEECRECQLMSGKRPWSFAVSAFPFEGKIRHWIHQFKYRKETCFGLFFATHLAEAWRKYGNGQDIDMIIPVPLNLFRYCKRGYNQAAIIAELMGKQLKLPVGKFRLVRWSRTKHQASMNLKQRKVNIRKEDFKCPFSLKGKRILLVDDVMTTGSTLAAATEKLLSSGASSVCVATIARDL